MSNLDKVCKADFFHYDCSASKPVFIFVYNLFYFYEYLHKIYERL